MTLDDRIKECAERLLAAYVAGSDPQPILEELTCLKAEKSQKEEKTP